MALYSAALLPMAAVADGWDADSAAGMEALLAWAKVKPALWKVVADELGDDEMDMAIFAALDPYHVKEALFAVDFEDRKLKPVEYTKIGRMHAAARFKFGMPPTDPFADPPAEASSTQGAGLPTQGGICGLRCPHAQCPEDPHRGGVGPSERSGGPTVGAVSSRGYAWPVPARIGYGAHGV